MCQEVRKQQAKDKAWSGTRVRGTMFIRDGARVLMFENFLTLVSETGEGSWSHHGIRTVTVAC